MTRARFVAVVRLPLDLFLAGIVLLVALPLWWLPWTLSCALGRVYGYAFAWSWPLARRVATINIARAYGDRLSPRERRRLFWAGFASMGQSVAEGLQFARRFKGRKSAPAALCEIEDPALLHRLASGGPVVFVTAHLGSWEVAAGVASILSRHRGAIIVRSIDNVFLNAAVTRIRFDGTTQWIEKRGAVLAALARLRAGDSVGMLLDEDGGPNGIPVEFFGRPASTRQLAASLSCRSGRSIAAAVCVRRPGGKFLFRLAVVEPPRDPVSHDDAVAAMTQEIASIFERWIRDDPGQWRWMHWRWKHRPDGSRETYSRRDVRAC